jgi:hypothetical protein
MFQPAPAERFGCWTLVKDVGYEEGVTSYQNALIHVSDAGHALTEGRDRGDSDLALLFV